MDKGKKRLDVQAPLDFKGFFSSLTSRCVNNAVTKVNIKVMTKIDMLEILIVNVNDSNKVKSDGKCFRSRKFSKQQQYSSRLEEIGSPSPS